MNNEIDFNESVLEIDDELIEDFKDGFNEAYTRIQEILVSIEQAEDKSEDLNALFRQLHSIKGNCRMLQLNHLSGFVHTLEDILDDMRNHLIEYDTRYSDVVLLSLDRMNDIFDLIFSGDTQAMHQVDDLMNVLTTAHNEHQRFSIHICSALRILDPQLLDEADESTDETQLDLEFFKNVARFSESRLGYDTGMTERTLEMAEQLNALAEHPVDTMQLRVAIYVHDMGMAFLDRELLSKEGKLNDTERQILETHPELGAHLLSQLGCWEQASAIVGQHHERFDGTGYPKALAADDICPGAKILSLVDTFEAMTQTRAHREHKRTELRVIAEVNAASGSQFDPYWVGIFNQWIRQILVKRRQK